MSSDGTVISTLIGVFVVKLPGVFPTTSVPALTRVATHRIRLSSARTTTDCFPPTWAVTLLLPPRSTPVNDGTCLV